MRIIAGKKRGLALVAPKGMHTRPTMDRTREDIMNILLNGGYKQYLVGGHVADVFAGSGAVGLEMLSRGAQSCSFYENNPQAIEALRANCKKFAAENPPTFYKNALSPIKTAPFTLIFMDAPYHQDLSQRAVEAFLQAELATDDTLWVVQVGKDEALPSISGYGMDKEKKMAGGRVGFYLWQE